MNDDFMKFIKKNLSTDKRQIAASELMMKVLNDFVILSGTMKMHLDQDIFNQWLGDSLAGLVTALSDDFDQNLAILNYMKKITCKLETDFNKEGSE